MLNTQNYRHKLSNNNSIWIMYILIFFTILVPDIWIENLPAFRIEQFIVIIYIFTKLLLTKNIKRTRSKFIPLYAGFSIFIVLSIFMGALKGVKVILNDFFELYKILAYLGTYVITMLTVKEKEDKIKVLNFMNYCLLVSVIVAIQQYFNLFSLNEKYVPIIAPTQFRTLVNNYPYPRVVGMTGNPNVYAVMPGIGAIISWSLYSMKREKKKILSMIIFIFGVLMTKSRSGFIFTISGILTFTFLFLFKYDFTLKRLLYGNINLKMLKRRIIQILILILFVIVISNYLPEELIWRIKAGFNIREDTSFQARLLNWEENLFYFKNSPLFGIGPAKSIQYKYAADNEWLLLLRQYGIVGCLYFVFAFIFPLRNNRKSFFKYIYISILVGSTLYMIPAAIYNSFQLMSLIMILAGLVSTGDEDKVKLSMENKD